MENTPNPKCPRCRCYWKPDETDIKTSGLVCETCKKCRERSKKYYEENPDKRKEQSKKYREENKDKLKEKHKKYREENADKIKEYHKQYREENADKIKEYRKENADKLAENNKIYYHENKDKILEQKKQYYQQNADKIKEKDKKYYHENADKVKYKIKKYQQENADKIKEQSKQYREENADKIKEYHKQYREENKCEHDKHYGRCKICNLQLYLINLQRFQLWRCLQNSSLNKTKSSIEYLGCDAEYFMEYMKKKMDLWNETNEVKMDFTNIHIDHIKPVSAFNLDDEDEFLDCCNYTNMQPLLANDNLSKNNKWTDENDVYWCNNIINKEHLNIYMS